jgi:undecaprenyl diphosphate synthase
MQKEEINLENIPKHIAIIMDGNGRWAKQQGFLRTIGHESGSESLTKIIEECSNLGTKYLTLYTFSTENWNRPKYEVEALMKVLVRSLKKELKSMMENNIKMNAIGNIDKLPLAAQNVISDCIEKTKENTKMTLTLALSYGSR